MPKRKCERLRTAQSMLQWKKRKMRGSNNILTKKAAKEDLRSTQRGERKKDLIPEGKVLGAYK